MRPINEIIVHCTATRPDFMAGQSTSSRVSEIRRWHKARGWSDIGYHYLIDRDGTVMQGRPLGRTGAHVEGKNTGTIGISLFGGHGSSENDQFEDNFTAAQDMELRRLIAQLKDRFGNVKVTGHNQYSAKACPGFKVANWYNKRAARSVMGSSTIQASGLGVAGAVTTGATAVGALDGTAQIIAVVGVLVVLAAFAWIFRERIKKWARGIR